MSDIFLEKKLRNIWNSIVVDNSGSPLHSMEWAHAKICTGHEVRWFFHDDDRLQAAIPIHMKKIFGIVYGWVPDGIVFKGEERFLVKQLDLFLKKNSIMLLVTEWYSDCDAIVNIYSKKMLRLPFVQNRETLIMNLKGKTEDSMMDKYNKTTRKYVRRSIRNGVTCNRLACQDYDFFYRLYKEFSIRKGFQASVSRSFFLSLRENLGKDTGSEILRSFDRKATYKDKTLGFISVLALGNRSLEFLRVDNFEEDHKEASKCLTHSVLVDALNNGIEWYDFGGVERVKTPGVFNSKKGFGGDLYATSGKHIYV